MPHFVRNALFMRVSLCFLPCVVVPRVRVLRVCLVYAVYVVYVVYNVYNVCVFLWVRFALDRKPIKAVHGQRLRMPLLSGGDLAALCSGAIKNINAFRCPLPCFIWALFGLLLCFVCLPVEFYMFLFKRRKTLKNAL